MGNWVISDRTNRSETELRLLKQNFWPRSLQKLWPSDNSSHFIFSHLLVLLFIVIYSTKVMTLVSWQLQNCIDSRALLLLLLSVLIQNSGGTSLQWWRRRSDVLMTLYSPQERLYLLSGLTTGCRMWLGFRFSCSACMHRCPASSSGE